MSTVERLDLAQTAEQREVRRLDRAHLYVPNVLERSKRSEALVDERTRIGDAPPVQNEVGPFREPLRIALEEPLDAKSPRPKRKTSRKHPAAGF